MTSSDSPKNTPQTTFTRNQNIETFASPSFLRSHLVWAFAVACCTESRSRCPISNSLQIMTAETSTACYSAYPLSYRTHIDPQPSRLSAVERGGCACGYCGCSTQKYSRTWVPQLGKSLGGWRLDLYLPRFANVSESIRRLASPCGVLVQAISEYFTRISTN